MKTEILEVLRQTDSGALVKGDLDKAVEKTIDYMDELKKWNSQINLTAEKEATDILNRHFYESLQYGQALTVEGEAIDIGSGAGFPGIPLKILFPGLKITLVESQRKRASFLRAVVRRLELEETEVLHERAENLDRIYGKRFQYALFRAVTDLSPSLVLAAPLIIEGGWVITKKGLHEKASGLENLPIVREISIIGHSGVESKLMIFQKCFT